jgi:hypothetical protein
MITVVSLHTPRMGKRSVAVIDRRRRSEHRGDDVRIHTYREILERRFLDAVVFGDDARNVGKDARFSDRFHRSGLSADWQ